MVAMSQCGKDFDEFAVSGCAQTSLGLLAHVKGFRFRAIREYDLVGGEHYVVVFDIERGGGEGDALEREEVFRGDKDFVCAGHAADNR